MSQTQTAQKKTATAIMTKKLRTIGYRDKLEAAYEVMQERKIRHLPVIDERGAVIGLLSDRDLQRGMTAQVKGVDTEITFDPHHEVKDFMSFPILEVKDDTLLETIVDRMLKEKVSAFLVTDARKFPVGIVTTDDLLRVLSALLKKDSGKSRLLALSEALTDESLIF